MRSQEIDTLSILLDRMNGCMEEDLPCIVTESDKKAVELAIKTLKEADDVKKQMERNNRDAIEIADWCLRNAETLQRFGERIERNNPQCRRRVDYRKLMREQTDGK